MVISKKTMIVPRFQRGSNIFKGGGGPFANIYL